MHAPDAGAGQLQPVAGGDLEALADAEQEHPQHRQAGAHPGAEAGAVAEEEAQQRRYDDV
ncbi:hypothetical protein D3C72_2156990 [compost metagenome]